MLILLLVACEATAPPASSSPARLVRLTHTQWENTTSDLLGLTDPTGFSDSFVPDPAGSTFENDADSLYVTDTLWQQYQSAAESLAELATSDSGVYARVVPGHRYAPTAGWAERDAWISSFGRRAYRRPLTWAEEDTYRGIFERGGAAYGSEDGFVDGVRACLVAFLQAPDFIYRVEGVEASAGQSELDGYTLASKLSYALWNTMPDDKLLDAAEGSLSGETLTAQVERLWAAPEAHDTVADLHRQLLHVDGYKNIPREFISYEDYSLTESGAMEAEVYAYTDNIVFGGGTVADLFTSRRTFVDAQVAAIYGIEGVDGVGAGALEPVDLDPTERAGLLTLSGFLKWEASTTEENLIKRGAFVNTAFLCANLPPPPAEVPPLLAPEAGQSLRERIETHTSGCGGMCHTDLINPVGFAFGNYDENGMYQEYEGVALVAGPFGDTPIDASGTYAFDDGAATYASVVEFADVMAKREQVHRCYATHLLAYLESRGTTSADDARIADLTAASLAVRPLRDLVFDIVKDEAFRGLAATP
jgi:hypothetical protein